MSNLFAKDALVVPFEQLRMTDVESVGGKNASLGEMISQLPDGVRVPTGFATTAHAFRAFLAHDGLVERINQKLNALDVEDVRALVLVGAEIRRMVEAQPFPADLENAIRKQFEVLSSGHPQASFAVRSSATAEDLPDASFAGQQETFLNVVGIEDVLHKMKEVFASLYNDRAISYRVHKGFAHADVALSAGVQRMVRSDLGAAGVMFTIDTETGFEDVVFITSSYGLGETVVQGAVNPDEFYVHKPMLAAGKQAVIRRNLGSKLIQMVFSSAEEKANSGKLVNTVDVAMELRNRYSLSDADITQLAQYAMVIEKHYGRPMDIEWGKDGTDGLLYILQARPETVKSQAKGTAELRYKLKGKGAVLAEGRAIGQKIGTGSVRLVHSISEMDQVQAGDVLVTDMTDPNWEPVMKRASAIVTNRGGRTCHAAIIARELGIPAVVGCGNATSVIKTGQEITVSCAEGKEGFIYEGLLKWEIKEQDFSKLTLPETDPMFILADPERAFDLSFYPNKGVGLMRMEFAISNTIKIHPNALCEPEKVTDEATISKIKELTKGYENGTDYFVNKLAEAVSTVAAAFYPKDVIVRMSDFKSNEYSRLLGGGAFEPSEENPMIGWRGASRYYAEGFREAFALECRALKRVREVMGLTNVIPMVPFCRTPEEGDRVLAEMARSGLVRGENGLEVYVMCELPSNVVGAEAFAERFDGFSIGSNDLTQLTLGLDRDSALVADLFDERHPTVKAMIRLAIQTAHRCGRKIGICGQAPSDDPAFATFLVEEGIDSISLNPDSLLATRLAVAAIETAKPSRHGP